MRPVEPLRRLCLMAFDVARGGLVCVVVIGQKTLCFALLARADRALEKQSQARLHQVVINRPCQRFYKNRIRLTIP